MDSRLKIGAQAGTPLDKQAGSGASHDAPASPLSRIRQLGRDPASMPEAALAMIELLDRKFPFTVVPGSLTLDTCNPLALNSLRAEFRTEDGQHLFLKCHHEDGEADRVGEYYRSGILEEAGFPIDKALYQSSAVGEQLVIYRYRDRRQFPELHSVARDLESHGCRPADMAPVVAAFDRFQQQLGARYLDSLHLASPAEVAAEAVHGLYHRRLVDHEEAVVFGGRVREFYLGRQVELPDGSSLPFEQFWHLRWRINGQLQESSLHEALQRARVLLLPTPHESVAALTAHGDDHTGNLLYNPAESIDRAISYFDPAFAGNHIPALMAPCKALYHVCYAHPNMLYDPDELRVDLSAKVSQGVLQIEHDWQLTPLRQQFLASQTRHVWQPLLRTMRAQNLLPVQWRDIIGAALLCCPLLCKNLLAGAGRPNPLTAEASLLTFSVALQLADGLFTHQLDDP
ncbi:hypothetical protein ACUNV4_22115 [Granulosicoccus sp. 3-233]